MPRVVEVYFVMYIVEISIFPTLALPLPMVGPSVVKVYFVMYILEISIFPRAHHGWARGGEILI